MIRDLKSISMMFDFINLSHAQMLIESVNTRLTDALHAHIVDVLWREEAQQGRFSLVPVTSYDTTHRGGAKQDHIRNEDPSGLWSFVYLKKRPVWLENTKNLDRSKPVQNLAVEGSKDIIDPKFLYIHQGTDSIMAVPLFFRGFVRGVYCIELPHSGRLNLEALRLMQRLAEPFATMIWKADVQSLNDSHTRRVISEFIDSIRNHNFQDSLNPNKIGFIARPFQPEFNLIEECIRRILVRHGTSVQHHIFNPLGGFVVDDLIKQISTSQFGIADITGCNSNVILELGMMIKTLDKRLFILRQEDDNDALPFDLRPYNYYSYKLVQGPDVQVLDPGSHQYVPIEAALKAFISNLF